MEQKRWLNESLLKAISKCDSPGPWDCYNLKLNKGYTLTVSNSDNGLISVIIFDENDTDKLNYSIKKGFDMNAVLERICTDVDNGMTGDYIL